MIQAKKNGIILRKQGYQYITSTHSDDFYWLNYFHSLRTKSKLKLHKKECENKYFCNIITPSKTTKTTKFNQYDKSDKVLATIYADLECLMRKKMDVRVIQ